eukprot:364757-Chlamydomonas_euryale.AAC.4
MSPPPQHTLIWVPRRLCQPERPSLPADELLSTATPLTCALLQKAAARRPRAWTAGKRREVTCMSGCADGWARHESGSESKLQQTMCTEGAPMEDRAPDRARHAFGEMGQFKRRPPDRQPNVAKTQCLKVAQPVRLTSLAVSLEPEAATASGLHRLHCDMQPGAALHGGGMARSCGCMIPTWNCLTVVCPCPQNWHP